MTMLDLSYARHSDVDSLAGVHCRRGHRQGHRVEGKSAKIASDIALPVIAMGQVKEIFSYNVTTQSLCVGF